MNIALNLSSAQLRNLRNGKGIRINPTMVGSGVQIIIDPMNYHNLLKNLKEVKEQLCQWETMNWKRMKYKGLGYALVLVKSQAKYHGLRKHVSGGISVMKH